MPITLNKIANNIAKVTFSYGGDEVTISYYPARVTEKTFAQLEQFTTMDNTSISAGFEALNEIIDSLIQSWDVYEDDAQTIMFSTRPDRLAELPIAFRTQVLSSIMQDIRPEVMAPQAM